MTAGATVGAEPTDHPDYDPPWRDLDRPPAERAADLAAAMTIEEKAAQLVGVWVGADASGGGVAPHQADMTRDVPPWATIIRHGLGQLTRPFGSAPVDPVAGAKALARSQDEVVAASRLGIPALVHEECLAGFAAWSATAYPVPLSWGASFDPELVSQMSRRIGGSMRAAGVHQGLAPVLDVTRDYRWGRTEETIGEDPYLVGTIGSAYVRGLEDAGIVATLKHFVGYSASRAGRNLAPTSVGPRELGDVLLPPFEMALRLGGARSVMHSYAEVDGVPTAADESLLTSLLRSTWGFEGTVVADYFGIRFLETLHGVAAGPAQAAHLALQAGVDVELPTVDAYGTPLVEAVRRGEIPESLVDRALLRVLTQKAELGLLDPAWTSVPEDVEGLRLDDGESRDIALRLARESVVLLSNPGGTLPLSRSARVALVGPLSDDPMAMLGCYSFPAHVGVKHPDVALGIDIPTLRTTLADRFPGLTHALGCDVTDVDRTGIAAATELAKDADVCVVAVGDRSGLFGRGTSGEGCDADDLGLPGVQAELVSAVLDAGVPVVLVLLAGRPYALGGLAERCAAVVQTFFPGQQGGVAIAEVLAGEIAPSGRLPVSVPVSRGSQPGTYLAPALGKRTSVSSVDPTALFPFGHGLGYSQVEWDDVRVVGADPAEERSAWPATGRVQVTLTVSNTGDRPQAEVVQLYLHDPVAQVTRPVRRLIGYARVPLAARQSRRVTFTVPADVTSFVGLGGDHVVEPGDVDLHVARSSSDTHTCLRLTIVGAERVVGHARELVTDVTLSPAPGVTAAHGPGPEAQDGGEG